MARDGGLTLARLLGRFALWLMPLTIVFEWVGGSFPKTPRDRVLHLTLYASLFWLSDLLPARAWLRGWPRRVLGVALLALGSYLSWIAVQWLAPAELGLTPFVPPPWLAEERYRLLAPLVAAWPLALGASLLREPTTSARAYEQLGLWLALGFLLHFFTRVYVQSLPVLPSVPLTPYVLLAIALVLLGLTLIWRGSFALRLGLLLAAGLCLRVLGLYTWEINPAVRDMLALVGSAQDSFVAGHNPYALHAMQHGSELPLTYLPGLWLGYGVPRLLGLDLRLMGPVAELALFVLLALLTRRIADERRPSAQALVTCFAAVWLFSPSVQWNVIYAEPALWWGLLGCTLALTFGRRFGWAALALGYAIATRHFAVVIAPFLLLYFVRTRGLRASLPYLALTSTVAVLLIAPFVLADSEIFWFGTFRWLREYGPAHVAWFIDRFGLLSFFMERDALATLPLVQAGFVAVCLLGACLVKRERIPALTATALHGFILLNLLFWDSFLLDGAVAALAVIVTRPLVGETTGARQPERSPWRRAEWLGVAVLISSSALAGYLALTLVRSLRPRGHAEAHDFAVSKIAEGDNVIDRSERRLAFVGGSWMLRRDEVHAPIGGELYDGSWGGGPALHAKRRVWMITQASRDGELRASLARMGRLEEQRSFGDFVVQAIEPHKMRLLRLGKPVAGVAPRHCQVGPTNWTMIGVELSRERPVTVRLAPDKLGDSLLFAAGFPNETVVWPRERVELTLRGAGVEHTLSVENRFGMQWRGLDTKSQQGKSAELTVELHTHDPVGRTVCLEVLALDRR